jgi:hypothetical protein
VLPAFCFLIVLLVSGCGGERSFEADEFVDEVNREGAALILGEPLTSLEEGADVYVVSFVDAEEAPEVSAGHAHSGGSLVVTQDADAATAEFERCEGAVTLTCYRAANVVLYFDAEPTDEHVAKVDAAIRALAAE